MNTLFEVCCEVIRYIAATFNISYAACNILIFLHILPAVYLFTTLLVLISGFFKKSKLFGILCIVGALILGLFEFEYLWHMLCTYQLDSASFDKSVLELQSMANYYGTTYQIINIVCFIIIPLISIGINCVLISINNKSKKHGQ